MTPVAWIFLAAWLLMSTAFVIAHFGNRAVAAELAAERKHSDEVVALSGRSRFHYEERIRAITAELRGVETECRGRGFENAALRKRVMEVQGRELPQLDEIRARRAAAHGSQWGPS